MFGVMYRPIHKPLYSFSANAAFALIAADLIIYIPQSIPDSTGVTFSGTWPNVTMSLSTGCPFLGVGPFLVDKSYYIPDLANNTDDQIFWSDYGMAIYSAAQYEADIIRIFRYLRDLYWTDGLVSSLDVFDSSNNRGPTLLTDYAGDQYLDGVNIDQNPAFSDKGLDVGPARTNLFTGGPTGAELVALTAQDYCLQCVDGSVSCSYGTATPSTPLQFTATSGDTTFTPTSCTTWQLNADGGYVFPIIPPGATHSSSAATSGGNGASFEMVGEEVDGVELVTNGDGSSIVGWDATDQAILSSVSGRIRATNSANNWGKATQALSTVAGATYQITSTMYVGVTTGAIGYRIGTVSEGQDLLAARTRTDGDEVTTTFTATSSTTYVSFTGQNNEGEYFEVDNFSVQKLIPKYASSMLGALRGVADGVELWGSPNTQTIDENNYSTYDSETGECRIVSDGTAVKLDISGVTDADSNYLLKVTDYVSTAGSLKLLNPLIAISGNVSTVYTATTSYIQIYRNSGVTDVTFKLSVQNLLPATCTVMTEMYMGVGSDEIPTGTTVNAVTATNAYAGLLYCRDSSGNKDIARAYDGSTAISPVRTSWDRDEVHQRVVQANSSGFRVGYRRFESDGTTSISAWVWSSYATFDGSFDPLEYLRFGYLNTVPMWLRKSYMWTRGDVGEVELNDPLGIIDLPVLALLWNADGGTSSAIGPDLTYSYAGDQYVAGVSVGANPAFDDEGLWIGGGGYTNETSTLAADLNMSGVTSTSSGEFTENSASSVHYMSKAGIITAAGTFNVSITAEASDRTLQIMFTGAASATYANFDLQNGSITVDASSNARIEDLGDGTYRCSYKVVAAAAGTVFFLMQESTTAIRYASYEGNGTSTLFLAQFLVVESPYLYPYIPPGITRDSAAATSEGNGASFVISDGTGVDDATSTFVVLATMGSDSGDITGPANLASINGTVTGGVYLDAGGTAKISDGINTASVTISGGYSRLDEILFRVVADENTMIIGYKKSDEFGFTDGTSAAFKGTFEVADSLRLGFLLESPIWVSHVQAQSKADVTDEEIIDSAAIVLPENNVALSKTYTMDPAPNYGLTTNAGDTTDLTDGVDTYGTSVLWADTNAVGWSGYYDHTEVVIDLGEVKAIDSVSISTAANNSVTFPHVQIGVSLDGTTFYKVGSLTDDYFLAGNPMLPSAYIDAVISKDGLRAKGRYVALYLQPSLENRYVFANEIEIRQGWDYYLDDDFDTSEEISTEILETDLNRSLQGINQRFIQDTVAMKAAITNSSITEGTKTSLLSSLTSLVATGHDTIDDVDTWQAIMPFGPRQTALFNLQASLWRSAGLSGLSVYPAGTWNPVDLITADPGTSASALDIHVIDGEFRAAAFNLVNASTEDITVSISLSDLPSTPTVQKVLWTGTSVGYPSASALEDITPISEVWSVVVAPGLTQQVWLTFNSDSVTTGEYAGTITCNSETLPITLTVYPITFPTSTELLLGGFSYTDTFSRDIGSGNKVDALIQMQDRFVNSPWGSSTTLTTVSIDTGTDAATFTSTNLAAWMSDWPDAELFSIYIPVIPSGSGFPAEIASIDWTTQTFRDRVGNWITAVCDYLRGEGFTASQLRIHLIDEPYESRAGVTDAILWFNAIAAAEPDVILFSNPNYTDVEDATALLLYAAVDHICLSRNHWLGYTETKKDIYRDLRDVDGKTLCFYHPVPHAKSNDPYSHYRLQAWEAREEEAVDISYWSFADARGVSSFNEYLADPYGPFCPFFMTEDSVMDGKHMEAIREGIEDFEIMKILDDTIALAITEGVSGSVLTDAQTLAADAAGTVLSGASIAGLKWAVDKDRTVADDTRIEVLEAIVALNEAISVGFPYTFPFTLG